MLVIANIEDQGVIRKILAHLDQSVPPQQAICLPESRTRYKLACLKKLIIQTIGCTDLSGTAVFTPSAGIDRN